MSKHPDAGQRVLWLSFPFPPAVSAGVFRSLRFVRYLPDHGWNPVVLTVRPDEGFPVDESLNDLLSEPVTVRQSAYWRPDRWPNRLPGRRRRQPGLPATAVPAPGSSGADAADDPPASRPSRLRILRDRILATPDPKIWWAIPSFWPALRMIRRYSPTIIFSTAPPHSSHLLALWLKRVTRLPVVLDFRDPWARSPWTEGRHDCLATANQRLERRCVRGADAVILNTQMAREEFLRHYGKRYADRFYTIPNGFDPAMRERVAALSTGEPAAPDPATPFRICHVGTLYGRREIRPLIRAVARLAAKGHDIRLEQVGMVKVDYDLPAFVSDLGLGDHVRITPPVPHAEALRRMAMADALLLVQPESGLQVPGKLYEMLLFRKPVIGLTGEGETREIVRKYHLGPVADPADEAAIATAIGGLLASDTGEQTDWAAVQAAFDGRNQAGQLAGIFDKLSRPASN